MKKSKSEKLIYDLLDDQKIVNLEVGFKKREGEKKMHVHTKKHLYNTMTRLINDGAIRLFGTDIQMSYSTLDKNTGEFISYYKKTYTIVR